MAAEYRLTIEFDESGIATGGHLAITAGCGTDNPAEHESDLTKEQASSLGRAWGITALMIVAAG